MSEREIFRSFFIYGGMNEISNIRKAKIAFTIAKVTHARARKNGYYEGSGKSINTQRKMEEMDNISFAYNQNN